MQRRVGPNKVGFLGFLQPFADGLKLILKESVQPANSNKQIFQGAPFLGFYLAQLNWLVIPLDRGVVLGELEGGGVLVLIAISEIGIYSVLYAGWSANSKYPFLGCIRSAAQMISYSVALSLIILTVIFLSETITPLKILYYQSSVINMIPLLPLGLLFIISAIAETNRSPFDLPEAESELVAGFFTEHSAIGFTFFFLAEYTNIIVISTVFSILFLGITCSQPQLFFILWIRACLARLRFDQLQHQGWSEFQPIVIGFTLIIPGILIQI